MPSSCSRLGAAPTASGLPHEDQDCPRVASVSLAESRTVLNVLGLDCRGDVAVMQWRRQLRGADLAVLLPPASLRG